MRPLEMTIAPSDFDSSDASELRNSTGQIEGRKMLEPKPRPGEKKTRAGYDETADGWEDLTVPRLREKMATDSRCVWARRNH